MWVSDLLNAVKRCKLLAFMPTCLPAYTVRLYDSLQLELFWCQHRSVVPKEVYIKTNIIEKLVSNLYISC